MIKIKKVGFTLSEVLITLAVVGILALLVIPGLIKDTSNRASMSLLQGTVSNLNAAVQNELVKVGTTNIKSTNIWTAPEVFLKDNFDIKKICSETPPNSCYAQISTYRNLNGSSISIWNTNKAALLSNGVTIDIATGNAGTFDNKFLPVSIDLNGQDPPNIAGIDRHIVCIALESDIDKGTHAGDVGGCLRTGYSTSNSRASLLAACKSGKTEICYYLMEISGFDPNYMDK